MWMCEVIQDVLTRSDRCEVVAPEVSWLGQRCGETPQWAARTRALLRAMRI
jgi:hypothetical protein